MSAPLQVLLFRLGGRLCALTVDDVAEVVPICQLHRAPGLPGWVEGFLDLRGHLFPVVRAHRLLALPEADTGRYTPILILPGDERRLALLVDAVVGVVALTPEDLRPVDAGNTDNDCVGAEATVDGESVHLLDADRLLVREEHHRLAELGERLEARRHAAAG